MTLPTTTASGSDDDSDMFGPPRSTPPMGFHHHRSRVPMISPKLRQREERKRILQLCAHKLERIKDSETNLRRSVCINNTYCRLTDELRREKQSRYLTNLPKLETKSHVAHDNIFNPYTSCTIDSCNHHQACNRTSFHNAYCVTILNSSKNEIPNKSLDNEQARNWPCIDDVHTLIIGQSGNCHNASGNGKTCSNIVPNNESKAGAVAAGNDFYNSSKISGILSKNRLSSNNLDTDLEILDREINAINAPMPLIDPEITQGAEQLEKAVSSRKRLRTEDESDRLVREALSQFYIPPQQRLISAIEECPLDIVGIGMGMNMNPNNLTVKRQKIVNVNGNCVSELELDFDINQNQKDFEVIMDALRLGSPSPTTNSDSCGQAAMLGESPSVYHNLVVTSLET